MNSVHRKYERISDYVASFGTCMLFFYKVELAIGGSVINGATPSS